MSLFVMKRSFLIGHSGEICGVNKRSYGHTALKLSYDQQG